MGLGKIVRLSKERKEKKLEAGIRDPDPLSRPKEWWVHDEVQVPEVRKDLP